MIVSAVVLVSRLVNSPDLIVYFIYLLLCFFSLKVSLLKPRIVFPIVTYTVIVYVAAVLSVTQYFVFCGLCLFVLVHP